MSENNQKREVKVSLPLLILIIALIVGIALFLLELASTKPTIENEPPEYIENNDNNKVIGSEIEENVPNEEVGKDETEESGNKEEIEIKASDLVSVFDLSFLRLENGKENKIYSPLSIKYALNMLEEGASGEARAQIEKVIENESLTKYKSNSNMSFANALFVRDSFAGEVKESYKNTLKSEYDAEVIADSFETPKNVNNWVSEKTLNLINDLFETIEDNYLIVNALGIDMEWKDKFLHPLNYWNYSHESYYGHGPEQVSSKEFGENKQDVSGMEIMASINNYDITEELGRENIIQTVSNAYREWANRVAEWEEEEVEKMLNDFLYGTEEGGYESQGYLKEIDENYGKVYHSTDFSIHVDDNVKVFAKDLKEYDGTTLQYIGIMPVSEELDNYINNVSEEEISNIIANLKELKPENFKQGVVTEINGYIPKFDFEYELDLKKDLKNLGITDVFIAGKANLTGITDNEGDYINTAKHKASIEFTQDGIKAAAVTVFGGAGGGDPFDYLYEVPVEKIDLTFDKPYMFLIRDKETGEIWFVGTVYEPLLWENEAEKDITKNI